MIAGKHGDIGGPPQPNSSAVVRNGNNLSRWSRFGVLVIIPVFLKIHKYETNKTKKERQQLVQVIKQLDIINQTLPKAQRTQGLSLSYQSNFLNSYHKFKNKS